MTNYALGARGIDGISVTQNGTTSVGYPIYDAHGNRVASMTKHYSGQNVTGWDLLDVRTYDAWGNITNTNNSGRPRARYCANLGHVQDDESGLVYMRARYYEPTSGRFICQDPARQTPNLFQYCSNNPVGRSDLSGMRCLDELLAMSPTQLLAEAQKVFSACLAAFFNASANKVALNDLTMLANTLKRIARTGDAQAMFSFAEGEATEEAGAYFGDAAPLGIDTGEAQKAIGGGFSLGAKGVASIELGQVRLMIEILEDGGFESF